MRLLHRTLAVVLASSMTLGGGIAHAAPTALVSTEQLASAMQPLVPSETRARLQAVLDRAEVAAELQARGVSAGEVQARVNALTDAEAAQLLAQIDRAPAGGDVVSVLFTLFVILLVTDILGLTKVFTFTRSVR